MTGIESVPCFVASLMSINVTSELPSGLDGVWYVMATVQGSERYVPLHAARSSDTFLWEQVSHARGSRHICSRQTESKVTVDTKLRGHFNL